MDIVITIDDSKVEHFSEGAKKSLEKSCQKYANAIIAGAQSNQKADPSDDGDEINVTHVQDASRNYKRSHPPKKSDTAIIILVDVLLAAIGILFDQERLIADTAYLIFYIVLVVATIVLLVIKYGRRM